MHTKEELKSLQNLSLEDKITLTKVRIQEFAEQVDSIGGGIYISFSGGKDSTVLLNIARQVYPNIKAVFVDTGLEFPELKEFVKRQENIEIIRPKKSFKQVIEEYGWVFPSKEVSSFIKYARKGSNWAINKLNGKDADGTESKYKQRYKKWKFLLNAPVKIGDDCCNIMKKRPIHEYNKKNNCYDIVGTLAEESALRMNGWLNTGCNSFKNGKYKSRPLSFWTEQDILKYIYENNIEICSVYGEVVLDNGKYITTGEHRTGCVFCPISCHLSKPNRFQRLKVTHPQLYDYCINKLGLKELLDYVEDNLGKKLY